MAIRQDISMFEQENTEMSDAYDLIALFYLLRVNELCYNEVR